MEKINNKEVDNLTEISKELSNKGIIGIHKYNHLKEINIRNQLFNKNNPKEIQKYLSKLELEQIKLYEESKITISENSKTNLKEYHEFVRTNKKRPIETIPGIAVNKSNLYHGFKQVFKQLTGDDFIENSETIPNIEAIVKYFSKDETFFNCKRVIKSIDGSELIPSFKKGILILGNYGNGKSTILRCFEILINHNYTIALDKKWDNILDWKNIRFKIVNTHELVTEYESFSNQHEKDVFIKKYSGFRYGFDDIKKESDASNYGKKNLIRNIFEKRYDNKSITHGTCNYHNNYPNNTTEAIKEFGEKYGGHIYDRIFLMYNIIEFKGKSFRK